MHRTHSPLFGEAPNSLKRGVAVAMSLASFDPRALQKL